MLEYVEYVYSLVYVLPVKLPLQLCSNIRGAAQLNANLFLTKTTFEVVFPYCLHFALMLMWMYYHFRWKEKVNALCPNSPKCEKYHEGDIEFIAILV